MALQLYRRHRKDANVPKPELNMGEFWNKRATEESDENPVQLSFMNERYATGPAGSAVCSIGTSVLSLKFVCKSELLNQGFGRQFCAIRRVLDSCCGF